MVAENEGSELEQLEVAGPSFNLVKDGLVPFPGVPGAAIPRRFTAAVRDPANDCTVQLEVVVDDGRPRMRSLTVRADGNPLTPTGLRRLPIGSYLDAVVTVSVWRVQSVSQSDFKITPIADFDEAFAVTKAGKAARRRRQPVTRERLAAVASAYQAAPARRKSEYVAERLDVDAGYARQLIHRARKEGMLP